MNSLKFTISVRHFRVFSPFVLSIFSICTELNVSIFQQALIFLSCFLFEFFYFEHLENVYGVLYKSKLQSAYHLNLYANLYQFYKL